MDALHPTDVFLFEDYRLDRRGLFRRDQTGVFSPVKIGSRAFDLLRALVDRPSELMSKDALVAAVWPGTVVEESNLPVQIKTLRGILSKPGARSGSCIQTVAGRGYRFIAPVLRQAAELPLSSAGAGEFGARPIPRLSIVVLPLAHLGDNPEQQYLADAITDDLTTDLSRIGGMFVISRSTAFTYRDKRVEAKEIGRELGVRYVLEGSVRRLGDRIRVNAQLVDAEVESYLWAERLDFQLGDLFACQDEISRRIAIALNLQLVVAEAARPTAHPEALDYVLRARAITMLGPSPESHAQAVSLYERALAVDPHSIEAQIRLAGQLVDRVLDDMTASPETDIERAQALLDGASPVSPRSALAHYVRGQLLRFQLRYEDAIQEYEATLALNRNHLGALVHLGICKFMTGWEEEIIPLAEQAIRLSPRDPNIANRYYRIGLVHLYQSRTGEAIDWLRKACRENLKDVLAHWTLAAAYGYAGDRDRAAAALAEARELDKNGRHATVERVKTSWVAIRPDNRFENIFLAGLRNAGLPEN
jgi:TolB-like protein